MSGERLRTVLLAGLFVVTLVGALVNTIFGVTQDLPRFGPELTDNVVLAVSAAAVVYEWLIYRLIDRRLHAEKGVPAWAWYLNAFVEISIPTIAIYFVGWSTGDPVEALTSPFLILYFIFILLSVLRLRLGIGLFTGAAAAVQYIVLSVVLVDTFQVRGSIDASFLSQFYVERAIFFLLAGVGAGLVARELRRWMLDSFQAYEEGRRVVHMFGQYTSPEIARELLEHGWRIESQRKRVCVMFVDVRGFTAFAEQHTPEEVVNFLNRLLEFMIEEVNAHHGMIHQLLGDGFMAVFGAPVSREDDVVNAVAAARAILDRLEARVADGTLPPTEIGIGIHYGEAIIGPVGSSIHKEYKITGDVVNVAARLERLNKTYGSRILVSGPVWERIRDSTADPVTDRGTVEILGRMRPVEVYQLA